MAVRYSQRYTNILKRDKECQYWTKLLTSKNEKDKVIASFIYNHGFISYWNIETPYDYYYSQLQYNMIKDVYNRGFLLYCINDTLRSNTYPLSERQKPRHERNPLKMEPGIYIEIVFVKKEYRRQHILTKMFQKLQRLYPQKVMGLYATDNALPVWIKLGFVSDPSWIHDKNHLIRFPGKDGGLL